MRRRAHGEGTILHRKDGRWQASFIPENGKRLYFYGKTRQEALAKMHQAQYEQRQGILATGPQVKLADYLMQWLEQVQRPVLRKISTYYSYRSALKKHIIPSLGYIQVRNLKPQQIQAFYTEKLDEGYATGTVKLFHIVLHMALENAVKWNLISRNVCSLVKSPTVLREEMQTLTQEQAKQLLQAVSEHRLEMLLMLALVTGMRKGELLGLRWQDISFEGMSLQVRRSLGRVAGHGVVISEPKTAKGKRKIMLPSFVVDMLWQHRTRQQLMREKAGSKWRDTGYVFCNRHGGHIEPANLHVEFKKVLKQVGLPDIRFHDLRHSAATILFGMGIHPKVVQELLGHSSISITLDTYSHMLPSIQREAMDKWKDVF